MDKAVVITILVLFLCIAAEAFIVIFTRMGQKRLEKRSKDTSLNQIERYRDRSLYNLHPIPEIDCGNGETIAPFSEYGDRIMALGDTSDGDHSDRLSSDIPSSDIPSSDENAISAIWIRDVSSVVPNENDYEYKDGQLYYKLKGRRSVVYGRSKDADIVTSSSYVSKIHFRLFFSQGDWKIEDMDSRNGTFVNGLRLTHHVSQKVAKGDLIQTGKMEMELV